MHETRNTNKAALKAQLAEVTERAKRYRYDENQDGIFGTDTLTSLTMSNKVDQKTSSSQGQDVPLHDIANGTSASDSAVLTQYPPSLLRLLVLLSPAINVSVRFVHLATWTGGPGTASHSFMLVLAWWAICLYGYEILRYCPQLALLVVLAFTGVARAVGITQGKPAKQTMHPSATLASSDTLKKTIENITVLADFVSTFYTSLVQPIKDLFFWHDSSQTFGLAVFLISSWPAWLLLFSGTLAQVWDALGLNAITRSFYVHTSQLIAYTSPHVRAKVGPILSSAVLKYPALFSRLDQALALLSKANSYSDRYVVPHVHASLAVLAHHIPNSLQQASGPRIGVFPILALRVRHLLLVAGTIGLTWCSPWLALIRHALWRSALVRRSARLTWSILSGQIFFSHKSTSPFHQGGRLTIGPHGEPIPLTDAALSQANLANDSIDGIKSEKGAGNKTDSDKVRRHEDVVYQFTIFENQRWWMGLDWTAALLPQERPSWADESNNPVSPPASFSLPQTKSTLKHTPTSKDSNAYTKRIVRWQWIDPEWTVAGRDHRPSDTTSSAGVGNGANARRASIASAASATSGRTEDGQNANDLITDSTWLDVDPEGWQYGDNGWDKMSKKSGLGRYTRRRRWVRRAILVELVQTDYHPTADELAGVEISGGKNQPFWSNGRNEEKVEEILQKKTGENVRERLAKAAANGSSVGTAQNTQATKLPTSTESDADPTAPPKVTNEE